MPSTMHWTGAAAPIAQVTSFAFGVTWIIGEHITVAYGAKTFVYVVPSATISVIVAGLVAALNALDPLLYPEFAEQTASGAASPMLLTAVVPGRPFTAVITTNSAAGTITPTVTVPSSGPEDVSTAANYSGGALPVSGDTLDIDLEGARLKYGLAQAAVVLAVRRTTAKDVEIGLPRTNETGAASYLEYRPINWQITATIDYVNTESGRIQLDHGTGQTTYEQDASGTGADGIPAVLLNGTHASNAWTFNGGEAALAHYAGDAARANVLRVEAGVSVTLGTGCVCDTLNNYGGTLYVNSAIATAMNHPGTGSAKTTIEGDGAIAQITAQGGTVSYNTIGALGGDTVLGGNAIFTLDGDQRPKTITNPIQVFSPEVQVLDSFGVVAAGLTLQFVNCAGSVSLRPNQQVVVTNLP